MNILLAPDSFKGSLSGQRFCEVAGQALWALRPDLHLHFLPLADGGEGTLNALQTLDAQRITLPVHDPLHRPHRASYLWFAQRRTAIVELAEASGLQLLRMNERNPLLTSTLGTGELLADAMARGAETLLVGLGGSASNDGGMGILQALGFRFYDQEGDEIEPCGAALLNIHHIEPPAQRPYEKLRLLVGCDVDNPLLGETGAAMMYAGQKGASREECRWLEQGMSQFVEQVEAQFQCNIAQAAGSGAAGGAAAGLQLLGAELCSGFDLIADFLNLRKLLEEQSFDWIITGEGEYNRQSEHGKVPVALARLAKEFDVPVIAVVGGRDRDNEAVFAQGFQAIFSLQHRPMSAEQSMADAEKLLFEQIQNIARLIIPR